MTQPLLSIAIPTRNRVATCAPLVRHLVSITSETTEILIQDCGAPNTLPEALGTLVDHPRVHYEHRPDVRSMTGNWNAISTRWQGEFVCLLGDDDFVLSDIEAAVRWLGQRRGDALISTPPFLSYDWPDVPDKSIAASCTWRSFTGKATQIDPLAELRANLATVTGGTYPRLYNGVVRRTVLDRLASAHGGDLFVGVTPDFFLQFRLCLSIPSLDAVDYPLIIAGRSASANSVAAGPALRSAIARHLGEFDDFEWPSFLPSQRTAHYLPVVTEALVMALRYSDQRHLEQEIDLAEMYAVCIRYDKSTILENLGRYACESRRRNDPLHRAFGALGWSLTRKVAARVTRRLRNSDTTERASLREIAGPSELDRRILQALAADDVRPPWADR